jgi:O-antigen ligase
MLFLYILFLPLSPTLKSIFFALSVASILFVPHYSRHLWYAFNTLSGRSAVLFFLFIALSSLWSSAPYYLQLPELAKYCKLIYLPILAVGFIEHRTRVWTINSFLIAACITLITALLKMQGYVTIGIPGDPGDLYYNHIITGFMMALAGYYAGWFATITKGWGRVPYLAALLMTSYFVLFINTGRTGYVLYFVLMSLLIAQRMSLKKAALALVVFSGGMLLAYHQSTVMQIGFQQLVSDVKFFQENKPNTSFGFRMQFHQYAQSLFETRPLTGIGLGNFKYTFMLDDPIPAWSKELNDPHSQYWMTLVEQGLIGLALLIFFLSGLLITAFKVKETRALSLGTLLVFCAGSFSDTILCYSTAGYLLITMSAISFGELIEGRRLTQSEKSQNLRKSPMIQICA